MKEQGEKLLQNLRHKIPAPALLVLALGCLLMLFPTGDGGEQHQVQLEQNEGEFILERFEQRLERVLSELDGAGETQVVLSLESGSRQILAQDRQNDSAGVSTQTITVGGAGDQQVVPIQTVAPAFRGALVVCQGAGDAQVRLEITKAVGVLTGLGTDRICVTTGKP